MVGGRDRGSSNNPRRTNSGRFDHVADSEPLDGLVLGRASRAVAAADGLDVAASLLVATAGLKLAGEYLVEVWMILYAIVLILSLLHHFGGSWSSILWDAKVDL
jgi:hypothetical protein